MNVTRQLELDQRQLLVIDDACCQVITCERGELWLTLDGDRRDIILPEGRSWRFDRKGPIILSAFKPSLATVVSAQPDGAASLACREKVAALLARVRRWRFPPLAKFPAHYIF